ncbi:MAG: carboxypeptidase regulatory-like domain-containing protein [Acidobacteria bacterium]|nr:carboxypeptidase regulatory-like domain-containing protein [Acidobacteriota bacterium]
MADVRSRSIFFQSGIAVLAVLAISMAAAPALAAPPPSGEVDGQVQDAAGKPLAGVAITLLKAGESAPKKQTSGADGGFKFNDLPSGVYIATAALEGYGPVTCRGIRLVAGQSRRLEVKLLPAGGEPSTCASVEPGA